MQYNPTFGVPMKTHVRWAIGCCGTVLCGYFAAQSPLVTFRCLSVHPAHGAHIDRYSIRCSLWLGKQRVFNSLKKRQEVQTADYPLELKRWKAMLIFSTFPLVTSRSSALSTISVPGMLHLIRIVWWLFQQF